MFSKQTMGVCGYNPIGCPSLPTPFSATPIYPGRVGVGWVLLEILCLLWPGVCALMA